MHTENGSLRAENATSHASAKSACEETESERVSVSLYVCQPGWPTDLVTKEREKAFDEDLELDVAKIAWLS